MTAHLILVYTYYVRRDCFILVVAGLAVGYRIVLLCYAQEVNTLHCPPAVRVLDKLAH